ALGLRSFLEPSVSDYLFHRATAPIQPPRTLEAARKDPELSFLFDALSPEYKERIAALTARLGERREQLTPRLAEAETLHAAYTGSLRETTIKASLDGVSEALWTDASLGLARGPAERRVSLRLE